jgi:hypothetical protein
MAMIEQRAALGKAHCAVNRCPIAKKQRRPNSQTTRPPRQRSAQ